MGSLAFHALLLVIAGGWVVRSVHLEKKLKFAAAPPPAAAPRQKQLEYKVQDARRQNSMSPPPGLTRITSSAPNASISLPASPALGPGVGVGLTQMSSMAGLSGASFSAGAAGSAMRAFPVAGITAFGFKGPSVKGLRGTYHDLTRKAGGDAHPLSPVQYLNKVEALFDSTGKMDPKELSQFFKSTAVVSGCMFCFPPMSSNSAPSAFGEEAEARAAWLVRYSGRVALDAPRLVRFVGGFDELLVVLVNGKLVLDGSWKHIPWKNGECPTDFKASGSLKPLWADIRRLGDWVEIGPRGVEIEIIIGEGWGGAFSGSLCVEEKGVTYPGDQRPVFKIDGYQSMQKKQRETIEAQKGFFTMEGPTFRAQ